MRALVSVLVVTSAIAVLHACSPNRPADAAADVAGDVAADFDAETVDAVAGDDAIAKDADDVLVDANPQRIGRVVIAQVPAVSGMAAEATESAEFFETADGPPCARQSVDACVIDVCPNEIVSAFVARRTAGAITIAGGTGTNLVLQPDTASVYAPLMQAATRWRSGDMLTVSAAGSSDVSMFAQMILAPVADAFTTPTAPAAGARFVLDRGVGFTVTWPETSGSDDVVAWITQVRASDTVSVECRVPPFGGSMVVSPSVLTALSATTGGMPATTVRIGTRAGSPDAIDAYVVESVVDIYSIAASADVR